MNPDVNSIKIFKGDTGLSLSVYSQRGADGQNELDNIVNELDYYYTSRHDNAKLDKESKKVYDNDEASFLYKVLTEDNDYLGSVKVTPKGSFSRRPPKDYRDSFFTDWAIAQHNDYLENYWINFFPQDKTQRAEHRDGFAKYLDYSGEKTKRN